MNAGQTNNPGQDAGGPLRAGLTIIEVLIVLGIIGILVAVLMPAIQQAREAARMMNCQSNLRQVALGVHQYYDVYNGRFFLHHPFDADVISQAGAADSFAEIYWQDKIMPFVGGAPEANEALAAQGINVHSNAVYRCPADRSVPSPDVDPSTNVVDGLQHRTSYLMNSLLSHKTRRYGLWSLPRFQVELGLSNFICFSERDAAAFSPPAENDPRQDDYDIWLGTEIIEPWIAGQRHNGAANYLYLDGHVVSKTFDAAVSDMYPYGIILIFDGSFPN